jgi:hypothetical protein
VRECLDQFTLRPLTPANQQLVTRQLGKLLAQLENLGD